jgi:hypothetical protein
MGSTKAVDSVQRGVVTRCFVLHPTIFSRLTHAHVPMLSLAKYLAAGSLMYITLRFINACDHISTSSGAWRRSW